MAESKPPPGILAPVIIFLGIIALTLAVPAVGLISSIFLPTPIILIFLANGRRAGWISAGLLFFILLALAGPNQAVVFLGEFAVMAIIMAESIKADLPFEKCIAFSAMGAAVISLSLLLSVHVDGGKSASDFFQEQVKKSIEQTMESIEESVDEPADVKATLKFAEESSKKLALAYPAFLAVGTLLTAIINFFAVRFVWRRFYGATLFSSGEISKWVLPDQFVWPLIFSGLVTFFASGGLEVFGLNLLILILVVYFLQGMAVVIDLLNRKNAPVFLRVIIFVIVFTQPLFMGILIGMGVFDLWVDFRKIRVAHREYPDENERG